MQVMVDGGSVERFSREVDRFKDFIEDIRATTMDEVRTIQARHLFVGAI